MRIAIVGCGNIAPRYADRIAAIDGLELLAATDVNAAAAERFVARSAAVRTRAWRSCSQMTPSSWSST